MYFLCDCPSFKSLLRQPRFLQHSSTTASSFPYVLHCSYIRNFGWHTYFNFSVCYNVILLRITYRIIICYLIEQMLFVRYDLEHKHILQQPHNNHTRTFYDNILQVFNFLFNGTSERRQSKLADLSD